MYVPQIRDLSVDLAQESGSTIDEECAFFDALADSSPRTLSPAPSFDADLALEGFYEAVESNAELMTSAPEEDIQVRRPRPHHERDLHHALVLSDVAVVLVWRHLAMLTNSWGRLFIILRM